VQETLNNFLELVNETLTAAIVIVAVSLLLYNLSRNLRNRVTRSSSVVLACVTIAYVADVFVSLKPSLGVYEVVLRLQWLAIALEPAAIFHLSDALLATTGQPSRGRRRRVIRILYAIGVVFFIAAALTDILISPVNALNPIDNNWFVSLRPGYLFPIFVTYFLTATAIAWINVQRARQRCLTRDTRRRMGYLQIAMLTPALGLFPYSVLLGPGTEFTFNSLLLVNIANVVVVLLLLFLAYPLSFFGSAVPDRVVKTELLRFVLRGPATALLALVVILFTVPTTRVLGLPGQAFMPFAVVAVVLLWQWIVALTLPWLEKRLIYPDEDDDQLNKLHNLSDQILTRGDILQLLEATLAATCDYLRVNTAFAVSLSDAVPEILASVGPRVPDHDTIIQDSESLSQNLLQDDRETDTPIIHIWHSYWIVALHSRRNGTIHNGLIGLLGIQARAPEPDLSADEQEVFKSFVNRAAQALDDLVLQTEIYAALEGLLPQISLTRTRAAEIEYRVSRQPSPETVTPDIDREQFIEQVRAALRHFWGGPGLTHSSLLHLTIVHRALPDNDQNAARALRAVLNEAIERQRPEGERKLLSPEWTIYNILDLRFVEKLKVRDVAVKLALSEPDLYRKQRIAIEAVADTLLKMEAEAHTLPTSPVPHLTT
jgi:GAF domain-containing protein